MIDQTLNILAASLYLASVVMLYLSVSRASANSRSVALACAIAGAGLHAGAQYVYWFLSSAPHFDMLSILSLCGLVIVVLLLLSALSRKSLFDAGLVALPISAAVLLLNSTLQLEGTALGATSTATTVHIMSSVIAFGFFSITTVYAGFVAFIDYFLRQHHLNALVRTLPALDVLELLLFQLITAGFVLLSISLATGLAYVEDVFAQHLLHKTVLSILAWLVFGLLLWGRWRYGWRGRLAVRMTLAGTALLLLAYFGSKFVLEVLLGRSWQSR